MNPPKLGWAALSRSALNRAEAQLAESAKGVRDEVGVLALHFGYANRFFPGTSVQQTRLRYALFVPWHLLTLIQDPALRRGQAAEALQQAEMALVRALPDQQGVGVIGRNTVKHGRPVSIPPSQSYWGALEQWGILKRTGHSANVAPSRADIFANLHGWHESRRGGSPLTDDEHRHLAPAPRLFHKDLPEMPRGFPAGTSITFELTDKERSFLKRRLADVTRSHAGKPALLAALVRASVLPTSGQQPWSESVRQHADAADQRALDRARDAAALSAVTRAVYLACVEHLKDKRDGLSSDTRHRTQLEKVVAKYGAPAVRLDVAAVASDGVFIGALARILEEVQAWLEPGRRDPGDPALRKVIGEWEHRRKGRRARLTLNGHGRDARADWQGGKAALAAPIGYRWSLVRGLLADLHGVDR